MKKAAVIFLLLFAALIFASCRATDVTVTEVPVTVLEGEHYTVETGQAMLEPGGSVSFYIHPDDGFSVTAADYDGEYGITESGGRTRLELVNIRYPTRVRISLTRDVSIITYDANGGKPLTNVGTSVTERYDILYHTRPNVSIGTDLFYRDGFILTGWNTAPDGSGIRVGLGSRVTPEDDLTLYAQWAEWTPASMFEYREVDGKAVITSCSSTAEVLAVPETIDGLTVTEIAAFACAGCAAEQVILPKSIERVEENAFDGAALRELCFYDNIEFITDESFSGCSSLATLRINAIEDPYGYSFRRESVLADKLDLLINTMGEDRLVFYGGCSMWYNLIGSEVKDKFGEKYTIVNMAINGVASSLLQMEIFKNFLTEKDILIHTPEISSVQQLLTYTSLGKHDDKLWCAIEYNYDLISLVDIRVFDGGVLESLRLYLNKKKPGGKYTDIYRDSKGNYFFDETGSIPFFRDKSAEELVDSVRLDPAYLEDLSRLEAEYGMLMEKGVKIYVTFACVDIDNVPEEERNNVGMMGALFLEKFSAMDGVTAFGNIWDFIYHDPDYYDTVYHLLSVPAHRCTDIWLRDITEQFIADGLWRDEA